MRTITVEIKSDGSAFLSGDERLGFGGEHNAAALCFVLGSDALPHFGGAEYYRVVIDGSYSDKLYIADGQIVYTVPQAVMNPPSVHCQLVGYTESGGKPVLIAKSSVVELCVDFSEAPINKVSPDGDIFEKAMAACSAAAEKTAEQAQSTEEFAISAANSATTAKTAEYQAAGYAEVASGSAEQAAQSAELSAEYAKRSQEHYTDLNSVANAVKGSVSGTAVSIRDVSPIEHEMRVKLEGELPEAEETVLTEISGVAQGESVSFDGREKVLVAFEVSTGNQCLIPIINSGAAVVTSVIEIGAGAQSALGDITVYIDGSTLYWEGTRTVIGELYDFSGSTEILIDGEAYENGLITGFYIADGDVTHIKVSEKNVSAVSLIKQGKNLLPYPYTNTTLTSNGVTFTDNGDGTVTVSGTATAYAVFVFGTVNIQPNTQYCLSGDLDNTTNITLTVSVYDEQNTLLATLQAGTTYSSTPRFIVFNSADYPTATHINVSVKRDQNVETSGTVKPILEIGSVPTEYEPYVKPVTYTPNEDGTVDGVTSLYPSTSLYTDTEGVTVNAEYNRDTNKVIAELQNTVAQLQSLAAATRTE